MSERLVNQLRSDETVVIRSVGTTSATITKVRIEDCVGNPLLTVEVHSDGSHPKLYIQEVLIFEK